jgi:hypothetical protein
MALTQRFFTVGERAGRWWFITPDGRPFWSIGMNHIDSAALRYPQSGDLWRTALGNSHERWITERVVPDLHEWGFNTIGWVQEVVVRDSFDRDDHRMHRHSRAWTPEEYRWANMPYCHLLPFAQTHQWEVETRYPDVFSPVFEEWCDYVARDECARLADDPNLIGYFYTDCPAWAHAPWWNPKGPWFNPGYIDTPAGAAEFRRTTEHYYRTIHDAIRRYDPNHLILGDRYEGKALVPEDLLRAAAPYVDVLSFQYFSTADVIAPDLARWHALTGKPVLIADAAPPDREPDNYAPMIRGLRELPGCVGWHVCGAYLRNRCRCHGFRDERDQPVAPLVHAASAANHETLDWVRGMTGPA